MPLPFLDSVAKYGMYIKFWVAISLILKKIN